MIPRLAAYIALSALAACGSTSEPSAEIRGQYGLTAVNGQALPAQVFYDPATGARTEMLSGRIDGAGSQITVALTDRHWFNASASPTTSTSTNDYRVVRVEPTRAYLDWIEPSGTPDTGVLDTLDIDPSILTLHGRLVFNGTTTPLRYAFSQLP
jgi:hypothetical protein